MTLLPDSLYVEEIYAPGSTRFDGSPDPANGMKGAAQHAPPPIPSIKKMPEKGTSPAPSSAQHQPPQMTATYALQAVIFSVQNDKDRRQLIACISTDATEAKKEELKGKGKLTEEQKASPYEWFMFNDFTVQPIALQEVVQFGTIWKVLSFSPVYSLTLVC